MNTTLVKDSLGWGFLLWFVGYILGIAFFFVLPAAWIGWAIMPLGILMTMWVALQKINATAWGYYIMLAIAWLVIAVVLDYFFIVQIFKPVDGYYKIDVYFYYLFTFLIPVLVGYWRVRHPLKRTSK